MRTKIETATQNNIAPPAQALTLAQQPKTIQLPVEPAPKLYPPKIAKAIIAISKKVQPVARAGENKFHKYNYPKWADVLENLGPLILDHGLVITQSEVSHGGVNGKVIEITYEFTIVNEDGDVWPDRLQITPLAKLVDEKGVADDKAASKAHTTAQKYMLMQLFKVRTQDMEDMDQDAERPQQQQRRAVPSPNGKVKPHSIAPSKNETVDTWTPKFLAFLAKAETVEEVDQWDDMNDKFINIVAEKNPPLFNSIVDALNERKAELGATATAQAIDPEQWLKDIDAAFSGCEDLSTLAEEQERLMTPHKDAVGQVIWAQAVSIVQTNMKRIEAVA